MRPHAFPLLTVIGVEVDAHRSDHLTAAHESAIEFLGEATAGEHHGLDVFRRRRELLLDGDLDRGRHATSRRLHSRSPPVRPMAGFAEPTDEVRQGHCRQIAQGAQSQTRQSSDQVGMEPSRATRLAQDGHGKTPMNLHGVIVTEKNGFATSTGLVSQHP